MATQGFYVYIHRRISDGRVFYVGKGTGKRAWKKTKRGSYWEAVESKHGREVVIVEQGLEEQEAYDLEVALIAKIGLENLCNSCSGGMGGRTVSEQTREKMRASHLGKRLSPEQIDGIRKRSSRQRHSEETKKRLREINRGRKGRPHSEETKEHLRKVMLARPILPEWGEAISRAKKGKPGRKLSPGEIEALRARRLGVPLSESAKIKIGNANRGRKHTDEAKAKMSKRQKVINAPRKKPVQCSNGMEFDSSGDAANWLRSNGRPTATPNNIVSCCNGNLKSAYGFKWSHVKTEIEE